MTSQWAVITGGSSGIGAAIFRRLAQHEPNLHCLAVGRRLPQLEEARRRAIASPPGDVETMAADADGDRVRIVSADVSTPEGISAILSVLPAEASVKYLVHNAGTLGPIAPLAKIDRSEWRRIVATNLDAPLFLTQALLPHLERCACAGGEGDDVRSSGTKARVLHVSSGAAANPYVGWGPYCVTKAGLCMMYRCLATELSGRGILVGSVRPGVVDTPMQEEIRGFDGPDEHFPMRTKFHGLHETGKLETPENVAAYFHWLLSETGDEDFCAEEWDLRNSKDDEGWKNFCSL